MSSNLKISAFHGSGKGKGKERIGSTTLVVGTKREVKSRRSLLKNLEWIWLKEKRMNKGSLQWI